MSSCGRTFGGRFRADRGLKSDPFAETLLGTDLVEGGAVVIRTAPVDMVPENDLFRLEREARLLLETRDPWITPILELGRQDEQLYVATPFIEGIPLSERLCQGVLTLEEALAVGRCLLESLEVAHQLGVLHGRVKPSNLILTDGGTRVVAKLVDFSVIHPSDDQYANQDRALETIPYMAPEQAGVLRAEIDARADLYAVGVVLYECISGRLPVTGESVAEVLRRLVRVRPPSLRSLGLDVPRALDEVVGRLLRKDPRERYQTAAGARFDLEEIAAALAGGESDPAIVIGLRDVRHTLAEPGFVGRGREITALEEQLRQARLGQGGLVLIEAESGGGKTRLLAEFAERSIRSGARVLGGKGRDRDARRPFPVLGGIVGDLAAAARSDADLSRTLRRHLLEHREPIHTLFPELAATLDIAAPTTTVSETLAETRTLGALSSLFDALDAGPGIVVMLLDDCQWAAPLTLELLRVRQDRSTGSDGDPGHLVVVAAYRAEEVPPDHSLRAARASVRIVLPPLAASEVHHLAESMAGVLPPAAGEMMTQLSGGNPFFAVAALEGMVEAGALMASPGGWQMRSSDLGGLQSSSRGAAYLGSRLDLLLPRTLRLLSMGAVLGEEFDLKDVAALASEPPEEVRLGLEQACHRHFVWVDEAEARYHFVHDRLRQALLAALSEEERKRLHHSAALRIEQVDAQRVFELAYHFDRAEKAEPALRYAMAAAAAARSRHAFALAEENYRIASRCAHAGDRVTRLAVVEGLADVLALQGWYKKAAECLEEAYAISQGSLAVARLDERIAELRFRSGDVEAAVGGYTRALRQLGKHVPPSQVATALPLVWEALTQALHTALPRFFLGRKARAQAEEELLALRLYYNLSEAYLWKMSLVRGLWAHLRGLNLAERGLSTGESAAPLAAHTLLASIIGLYRRALTYAERALAVTGEHDDPLLTSWVLRSYALALPQSGQVSRSLEELPATARRQRQLGDLHSARTLLAMASWCRYAAGDLQGAVAQAREVYEQCSTDQGGLHRAIGLVVWSQAAEGRLPLAVVQAELEHVREPPGARTMVLFAHGRRLLAERRTEEAIAVFREARDLNPFPFRNPMVGLIHNWYTAALRIQVEQTPPYAGRQRQSSLRRLRLAARRALWVARGAPLVLPQALRESALAAALDGRRRRARKLFDQALSLAEQQGAYYEHALTRLARGRVGLQLGWPRAADDVADSRAALRSMGAGLTAEGRLWDEGTAETATLSLIDRFARVLEAGHNIASARSRQAVLAAVRRLAVDLLRAEHCRIFEVQDADGVLELRPATEGDRSALCQRLADRALETGSVLTVGGSDAKLLDEEMAADGVRSALVASILVRGRPKACFCVTSRQGGELFGEEEQRIARFIAVLAGSALDNVRGYAQVAALTRSLEGAAENERRRLALELHDGAGQALTALAIQLHEITGHIRDPEAGERFQETRALVDQLMVDLRRLSHELRPAALELGLVPALGDLAAAATTESCSVALQVAPGFPADLPSEVNSATFRIAQAALANVSRHSRASHARVSLSTGPAVLCFEVEDDGVGFDPDEIASGGGLGLVGMRERAGWLGGTFSLNAAPGRGTRVRVEIPLDERRGP